MIKKEDKENNITVKNMSLTTAVLGFCLLLSVFAPPIASATWGFRMGDDGYTPAGVDVNFRKIEFFIPDVPQNSGITWSGSGVSNFSNTQWNSQKDKSDLCSCHRSRDNRKLVLGRSFYRRCPG